MRSLSDLMSLKGRVALVTGAAGQLGRVFSAALAELGADVVLLDSDAPVLDEVAASLRLQYLVRFEPLAIDLETESQIREVPGQVLAKFPRLDILVNGAALAGLSNLKGWSVPFAEQSAATWRRALEVNLTAPFILTQCCAEALQRSGHGSVINIASIYGLVGPDLRLYGDTAMGNPAAYAASKGGILQLSRWLSTVLAPEVRVNSITPGGVFRNQPDAFRERYEARVPLGRMATEEDLKGAIAYLASDLSAYVTGQNLVVDGGWTAW